MTRPHAEYPLVLPDPLALAAHQGTKTQHRVPIAAANSLVDGHPGTKLFAELVWDSTVLLDPGPSPAGNPGPYLHVPHCDADSVHRVYPRRWVGDVFSVREAFSVIKGNGVRIVYRADDPNRMLLDENRKPYERVRWHHGSRMHRGGRAMPRLPRTWLQLTEVRAQRVQDVTHDDALAEGVMAPSEEQLRRITPKGRTWARGPAIARLECIWDAAHGRTTPWSTSPWAWVFVLKKIERPAL